MMMPPAEPHPEGYFDGLIYGAHDARRRGEWQPTFELEAPPGSAVVVFPGMVHETRSIGEECSSSVSQTFEVPVAAAYWRAFWPRLALIPEDVGSCYPIVESLVALGSGRRIKANDESSAKKLAAAFAAQVDRNKDGIISLDEIHVVSQKQDSDAGDDEERRTDDEFVSFHDVNFDGQVTVAELVDSCVMYATSMHRVAQMKRGNSEL